MRFVVISVIVGSLLLTASVLADTHIDSLLEMKENVRQGSGVYDISVLADSVLTDICNEALVWTSTEVGGVESRVRIITAKNQAFYALPDTVVEILAQTLKTGDFTSSIKAMYPQFAAELGVPGELTDNTTQKEEVPIGFFFWADTLQLFSVPEKVDTLYFYAYVEHPVLTNDTVNLQFTHSGYATAAVYLAISLVKFTVKEYEEAAYWMGLYEKRAAILRERFRRKFDLLNGVNR